MKAIILMTFFSVVCKAQNFNALKSSVSNTSHKSKVECELLAGQECVDITGHDLGIEEYNFSSKKWSINEIKKDQRDSELLELSANEVLLNDTFQNIDSINDIDGLKLYLKQLTTHVLRKKKN